MGPSWAARESSGRSLQRTEATTIAKQRGHHHWAWLKAEGAGNEALSGRYFISEELYNAWSTAAPPSVVITIAKGLLGAGVVTRTVGADVKS